MGIVTDICDYDPIYEGPIVYFYEVLVNEQKITIVERYLDGNVEAKEEGS